MINLLFESNKNITNVWQFDQPKTNTNFSYNEKFNRLIPWIYQYFSNQLNIITPELIDTVDDFIYPVSMNEPYILCRQLIHNGQIDYGFWSFVDDRVIESLRQGKGKIVIEANHEFLLPSDLEDLQRAIKDTSQFPNDRVHLIIDDFTKADNLNFHAFPKIWEAIYANNSYWENNNLRMPNWDSHEWTPNFEPDFTKKEAFVEERRRFCCFNGRSVKHSAAYYLPFALHELNLLKEGWISLDDNGKDYVLKEDLIEDPSENFYNFSLKSLPTDEIQCHLHIGETQKLVDFEIVIECYFSSDTVTYPLLSEKLFRPLGLGMPFVLLGQAHSLKKLHKLGFRTFHPLIDETYDSELDDSKRFLMVVKEIDKLCKMKLSALENFKNYINSSIYPHNVLVATKRMRRFGSFIGATFQE